MKKCCLCGADSHTEENVEGFLVHCGGFCGRYVITHGAIDDIEVIHGRKQSAREGVGLLRQQDPERLIRISHESVAFVP